MRLAIYSPADATVPLVLTPACMQPSLAVEHAYGHMCLQGTIFLDEGILPAIAHPVSVESGHLEFVIRNEGSARALRALMERRQSSILPPSLGNAEAIVS